MRLTHVTAGVAAAALCIAVAVKIGSAGPARYGYSDRVERHMMPVVSTGPLDPAWSPDGQWIAFAMHGDIWKVPAKGGEAIAITKGPSYYFEPAWSPDSKRLAFSMDDGTNLDIGVATADGGDVQRLTNDAKPDVEPTWSHDGRSVYFVSGRGRGWHIYRHDLDKNTDTLFAAEPTAAAPVPAPVGGAGGAGAAAGGRAGRGGRAGGGGGGGGGGGEEIQPNVSPDGTQIAYLASVPGHLGTGGIWVRPIAGGEPKLVYYTESEYRTKPTWTPDGTSIVFISDEMGSNDVMIVPVNGGNAMRVTAEDGHDEYDPTVSPDGTQIAFVSNRTGPTVLYLADLGGGPVPSWRALKITSRKPKVATGKVRITVLDATGKPTPSHVFLMASDGRSYAPEGAFHRVMSATEAHYFQIPGPFEVEVPAGHTVVEAMKGFEYNPTKVDVDVPAGGVKSATIKLTRMVDMPAKGWYSGDTHVHDLHQGLWGLSHQNLFDQARSEDLHVTNALIHQDGTRIMGRWGDLTGKADPLSNSEYVLQYGEEFRGSLGHIAMMGIQRFTLPFQTGVGNTSDAQPELDYRYLDSAKAQGGMGGYVHPYAQQVRTPQAGAGSLIPVDIALGHGEFYDVSSDYSDEIASADMYYKFLNCGFYLPATSGTDNFTDTYRDPPPGTDRAFVKVQGPLTLKSWFAGIRARHSFSSTGPIVTLNVDGKEMGDEIAVPANGPTSVHVKADARSISKMGQLDIIVNGKIAQTVKATDSSHIAFDGQVQLPQGGWVAVRVLGPVSRYVGDSYTFAQTTPVFVIRGGKKYTSAEDAKFLADVVDAIWRRVDGGRWRTPAEHEKFKAATDQAREVYLKIAAGGMGGV